MADFPTSKHTFTPFANGATSDAAQVTDIYTEVEAIEDGYLNGTARLNSSNSTAANLSVTGGSTVAGLHVGSTASFDSSVTFAGNVTITGNVIVNGTLTGTGLSLPQAKVTLDSSVTVANSTSWAGISWNVEITDAANLHSTASNSSRVNLTSSGAWLFGVQIRWQDDTPSTCLIASRVMLNDTNVLACERHYINDGSTAALSQAFSGVHYATSTTDYLVVASQRVGAGTIGLSSGTSTNEYGQTHFWVQKISN